MPLRPSNLPFNIGTDVARVSRFKKYTMNASKALMSEEVPVTDNIFALLPRFMTPFEQRMFWQRFTSADKVSESYKSPARYLAGRWAAKEAVVKAYQSRRLYPSDAEIHQGESGAPFAVVLDKLRRGKKGREIYIDWIKENDTDGIAGILGIAQLSSTNKGSTFEVPPDTDGQVVKLSISHDGDYAVATAIAAIEPVEGDVGGEASARDQTS